MSSIPIQVFIGNNPEIDELPVMPLIAGQLV
jgi:hypothetical protein